MVKPRVYVTFDEKTYKAISELTDELNASQSSFINQIMTDSIPQMEELLKTIRAAKAQSIPKEPVKSFFEIVHDSYSGAITEAKKIDDEQKEKKMIVRKRKIKKI